MIILDSHFTITNSFIRYILNKDFFYKMYMNNPSILSCTVKLNPQKAIKHDKKNN